MIARAMVAVLRRLFDMFTAGWLITLGVTVALIGGWLLLQRGGSLIGYAAAALIACALVADATLSARRSH
jgi:hypothetical protein